MAEKDTGKEPDIDVDDMDEAALSALRDEMRGEKPAEAQQETEKDAAATTVAETDKAAPDANTAKDDDDDEPEGKKSETVPHGQFHRERERRKALEAEKEALAQNYQKLADRLAQLVEAQQKPAEPAKSESDEPDPSDPLQQIAWLVKEVREGRMSREQASKEAQEAGARHEYAKQIQRVEDEFKAKTPDYEQALQFAAQTRDEELQLMYPMSTEEQRREFILREWGNITQQSLQAGLNPAERAYQFAVKRGFRPVSAEVEKSDTVEQITEREETRKAAISLGKTGGGVTQTGAISPEQLLEMSDAEFAAYKAKHGSVARAFAA